MIRTQIQLTEQQTNALKELAHRENASIAELTRRAIDYWLETVDVVSVKERRQRALAVVGRFHSGQSDISERHDAYLAEAYDTWSSS
ncbi:MAG: CopG family transcriptional regulator [Chloroflexi bacterium HGW-Chloroflexi-1]|nr:MAG: CopG family transcriptional regulator [Chloroflexi bacterium HGW-Chloroflexi-1]